MTMMIRRVKLWLKLALMPLFVTVSSVATAQQMPLLVRAAESNDVATVQKLIGAGNAIEARDGRGRTALMAATHANAFDTAQLLIKAGADVNAKDSLDDSPYLYAAAEGRLDILKMTLAAGADLKSINRYGGTGLTPAAHHGHIDVVRTLLSTDIDVDQINHLGWTALLEAVILGDGGATHTQIVRLLLGAGADRTIADAKGITPLTHARNRGFDDMTKLLERSK